MRSTALIFLLLLSHLADADSKRTLAKHLINLQTTGELQVPPNKEISVQLDLQKGWKVNATSKSWFALFDVTKENRCVTDLERKALQNRSFTIGKLLAGHEYRLQGTVFFCEEDRPMLCSIQSVDQVVKVDERKINSPIKISLRP